MENKTSKYFKYAIGEIVLVIIGILIALQINNWNENRVNTIKLKNYLTNIVKDLEADTSSIKLSIKSAKKKTIETKEFLALKDYNTLPIDSLEKKLETFYTIIPFNKSTFSKIQNSGITNYGKYEFIIEDLKYYYTQVIPDFEDTAATNNRAVDNEDNYWRYEQRVYEFAYDKDLVSKQSIEERKQQLVQLLELPTARNILKIDYRRNKELVLGLEIWNDIIVKLLDETKMTLND
jgi:hypothetical protein